MVEQVDSRLLYSLPNLLHVILHVYVFFIVGCESHHNHGDQSTHPLSLSSLSPFLVRTTILLSDRGPKGQLLMGESQGYMYMYHWVTEPEG